MIPQLATLIVFVVSTAFAQEDERQLQVEVPRWFPKIESVSLQQMKDSKRMVVAEQAAFEKPLRVPREGPFEVFVKPKNGIAVRIHDKLTLAAAKTHDLKLGELLGAVEVVGDDFPRAASVVLTDARDPGPGEKGHVAVQVVSDYRMDMLAVPGAYAVWVVPVNGARAQRVIDNVRVKAGSSIRVGD